LYQWVNWCTAASEFKYAACWMSPEIPVLAV
jgi:hypothetical protein